MKTKIIIIISIILCSSVYSQTLWDIPKPGYHYILSMLDRDTSMQNLKKIILDKNSFPDSYWSAQVVLAKKYNERDFLLNNLITNTPPDTSWENRLHNLYFSEKYVFDNIIKGYYGIQEAVDNLVAFAKDKSNDTESNEGVPRGIAIMHLAEGGFYQNFDNFAELYRSNEGRRFPLKNYMMEILIKYGKNPEYRDRVLELISMQLDEFLDNRNMVYRIVQELKNIDCDAVIEVLSKFYIKAENSECRGYIMNMLRICDPQNHPDRIMEVLPIETNVRSRKVDYYPSYDQGWNGELMPKRLADNVKLDKKGYLMPKFINFLKGRENAEPDETCLYEISSFLSVFKPYKPDSTHSLQYLMDDFQNYLEEVNNYRWINESSKYAEYKKQLEYAETNIANNEFEECRMKLEEFKNGIQNDFDNGLITNEAYRYLFFYPDYLIERLPDGVLSVPR